MTKDEIGRLICDKKFSKTIRCCGDDKLKDFLKEIYYDGIREGYELAKYRLEIHDLPLGAGDRYFAEHMEDIREILKLCEQYEACGEGEDT